MSRELENICILGATGSIGDSTLDVIARHDNYRVFALTANTNVAAMLALCRRHTPVFAVMADERSAGELNDALRSEGSDVQVRGGGLALTDIVKDPAVDTVMAAIVGAAGLLPTLAAVEAGKKVLLANKEVLVMAGDLFMAAVARTGAVVMPIDSEHNAIFQCLPEQARLPGQPLAASVRRVILTASGGPFLDLSTADLASVTPAQACCHPNWSMGQKISVDSATMMNKGLEFIEACHLFQLGPDHVDVVIHPQSIVHSMVEYLDGSVIAQMGSPDMRIPIAYGLAWPERMNSGASFLDLVTTRDLQFRAPDLKQFPCLALAIAAARRGAGAPVCLNAANELAVQAFLDGEIGFTDIPVIIERCLKRAGDMLEQRLDSLDSVLHLDAYSRQLAGELLGECSADSGRS